MIESLLSRPGGYAVAALLATLLLLATVLIVKRLTLGRVEGLVLVAAYVVYLAVFFIRGVI